MPFCSACGATVTQIASFCSACGQKTDHHPPSAAASAPTPAPVTPEKKKTHPLVLGCAIILGIFFIVPVLLLVIGLAVGTATESVESPANPVAEKAGQAQSVPAQKGSAVGKEHRSVNDSSEPTPQEAASEVTQQPKPAGKTKPKGVQSAAALAKPDPKERRRLRQEVSRLVKRGRAMEPLRHSQSLNTLQRCGEEMRRAQAQAAMIEKQAEAFEREARYKGLTVAARMVSLCVSCMTRARNTCDDVEDLLRTEKEINK